MSDRGSFEIRFTLLLNPFRSKFFEINFWRSFVGPDMFDFGIRVTAVGHPPTGPSRVGRPPTRRASGDFGEITWVKRLRCSQIEAIFFYMLRRRRSKIKQEVVHFYLFSAACRSVGHPPTDRSRGSTNQIFAALNERR